MVLIAPAYGLMHEGGCDDLRQWICCLDISEGNMRPIINLEETPAKIVGRTKPRPAAEVIDRMTNRLQSMGVKLPFPRGVFRFKTFEEADAWEMKHRIAAAVKRLRDHQP